MPTGSLTAVPNDTASHVYITGDFTATGATAVVVFRVPGTVTDPTILDYRDYVVIRPTVYASAIDGNYEILSGGYGVWYDTEMPLDTPVSYVAHAEDGISTNVAAGPVTVAGDGSFFLRDPLAPAGDIRIGLAPEVAASFNVPCVIPVGTYFLSMGPTESRGSNSVGIQVNNAPLPGVAVRPRGGIKSTLTLATRTFADRDGVLDLGAPGSPLLFQAPGVFGIPDQYMDVTDIPPTRGLSDHRQPWRTIGMPYTQTQRPPGLSYGVLGTRWEDICGLGTWGDAEDDEITWDMIMAGAYGNPPINPAWRTYTDVAADFASYTAVAAGGRTYEELRDGA